MRSLKHPSRQPIIKRLRRADGHLHSIVEMLLAERPTTEIAQQLQAVESAVAVAKRQLIHDQVQYCLGEGDAAGTQLRELRDLAKYL